MKTELIQLESIVEFYQSQTIAFLRVLVPGKRLDEAKMN